MASNQVSLTRDLPANDHPFRFLDLPLELRTQIYTLLLVSPHEWIRPITPWSSHALLTYPTRLVVDPWPRPLAALPGKDTEYKFTSSVLNTSILRTNSQIYLEANAILLRNNRIVLTLDEETLSVRQCQILQQARMLAIDASTDCTQDALQILASRQNLISLRLRVSCVDFAEAWWTNLPIWLDPVKTCAVATIDVRLGPKMSYLMVELEEDELGETEEVADDARIDRVEVELEAIGNSMLKKCGCARTRDGDHVERVQVGQRVLCSSASRNHEGKSDSDAG